MINKKNMLAMVENEPTMAILRHEYFEQEGVQTIKLLFHQLCDR